jgi:hypothetical protein
LFKSATQLHLFRRGIRQIEPVGLKTQVTRTTGTPMHVLDDLPTGTVRCVFSSSALVTINSLRAWGTTRPDGERKDSEHKLVGNSATHFYGLNNSPASLATLQEQMRLKGGSGADIARLKVGQFYFHSAGAAQSAPVKLKVPDCLSRTSV